MTPGNGSENGSSERWPLPKIVDRETWQAQIDELRPREKAHTREGDAIAAARRRLPMVEVDPTVTVTGPHGPVTLLDVFEGRRQLYVYFHMWHDGMPAEDQCEGCTFFNGQVRELSYLHSRDLTYATFCEGPYDESVKYRDFMGWDVPWYSARDNAQQLLAGRWFGANAVLRTRRGSGLRDLLDVVAGRRVGGADVHAARYVTLRTPRDVRGLTGGLATVSRERRWSVPHQRTSDGAVVATRRGTFRRSNGVITLRRSPAADMVTGWNSSSAAKCGSGGARRRTTSSRCPKRTAWNSRPCPRTSPTAGE